MLPEAKRRRYSKAQYQPLAQHYGERVFQIHVMDRYARLGAEQIRQALGLVAGYFSLGKEAFVRRFFGDRREMLTRATTAESFARIVDALRNPAQTEIVAAPMDGNRLVLAGPGAGKTRVVVHRCAYLLRVLRVPAHQILVLCFNRAAALELRRRLAALVDNDARHVTVQTYHGFAMRLTGHSYAEAGERRSGLTAAPQAAPIGGRGGGARRRGRSEMPKRLPASAMSGGASESDIVEHPEPPAGSAGSSDANDAVAGPDFDAVMREAVALLEGQKDLPGIEAASTRERLLAGYRHILVDEYQDIDAMQYRLVSAIAGRTLDREGDDGRLTLLAVGDDDQNIYAFRGASVDYIRRFKQDYDAELHYLVENYRSSRHIIDAANALIGHNRERMKTDQPIRIDRRRANAPAGGRWAALDQHAQGRVLVQQVPDASRQAAAIAERIQALQRLGGQSWRDFAVLARRHEVLAPVRALCEHAGIPVRLGAGLPGLHRIREIHAFLAALKAHGQERLTPAQLEGLLPERPGPWRRLLSDLIDDWRAELGATPHASTEVDCRGDTDSASGVDSGSGSGSDACAGIGPSVRRGADPSADSRLRPSAAPRPDRAVEPGSDPNSTPNDHGGVPAGRMKRALPLFHGDACGQIGDRRTDDEASDGLAVPAIDIAEFCWESLAEQRRERTIGDGVLLTTLHAAKGLEFPHVLIADGGWDKRGDHRPAKAGRQCHATGGPSEDERRVFYVGMTRARETLTLFEVTGGSHPHLPLLGAAAGETHERSGTAPPNAPDWLLREAPLLEPPPAAVIARRYTQLSLADLDLGYAGRQPPGAPVHRRLAALQAGDELAWRRETTTASSYRAGECAIRAAECSMPSQRPGRHDADGTNGSSRTGRTATDSTEPGQFLLTTLEGHAVARLSKRAAARWLPYADSIEAIRIIALIRRDRSQTEPEYATSLRCERWEIPLVEIRWRRRLRLAD